MLGGATCLLAYLTALVAHWLWLRCRASGGGGAHLGARHHHSEMAAAVLRLALCATGLGVLEPPLARRALDGLMAAAEANAATAGGPASTPANSGGTQDLLFLVFVLLASSALAQLLYARVWRLGIG